MHLVNQTCILTLDALWYERATADLLFAVSVDDFHSDGAARRVIDFSATSSDRRIRRDGGSPTPRFVPIYFVVRIGIDTVRPWSALWLRLRLRLRLMYQIYYAIVTADSAMYRIVVRVLKIEFWTFTFTVYLSVERNELDWIMPRCLRAFYSWCHWLSAVVLGVTMQCSDFAQRWPLWMFVCCVCLAIKMVFGGLLTQALELSFQYGGKHWLLPLV